MASKKKLSPAKAAALVKQLHKANTQPTQPMASPQATPNYAPGAPQQPGGAPAGYPPGQ